MPSTVPGSKNVTLERWQLEQTQQSCWSSGTNHCGRDYFMVCGYCKSVRWCLWGVRYYVEILLDQTAINAQSLPGSTTVNHTGYLSAGCPINHEDVSTLMRCQGRFMDFYSDMSVLPITGNPMCHFTKLSWYYIRGFFIWPAIDKLILWNENFLIHSSLATQNVGVSSVETVNKKWTDHLTCFAKIIICMYRRQKLHLLSYRIFWSTSQSGV